MVQIQKVNYVENKDIFVNPNAPFEQYMLDPFTNNGVIL